MQKFLSALALSALFVVPAAQATPNKVDLLGELCEAGSNEACRELAVETNGQCAAPAGFGCRYDSTKFIVIDPEEPMVVVPGLERLGWSRISTVQHCAYLSNVEDYDNLTTDAEFEAMEACLIEHT